MIKFSTNNGSKVKVLEQIPENIQDVFWVDLFDSTEDEIKLIEDKFDVQLFTKEESAEIENSSRYIETEEELGINLNFMIKDGENHKYEPVSFVIKGSTLFSQRSENFFAFKESYRKNDFHKPADGDHAFLVILDTRIDYLADIVEEVIDKIAGITGKLVRQQDYQKETLLGITNLQENLLGIRENAVEIQRLLTTFIKTDKFDDEYIGKVKVLLTDIDSILEYTSFCFDRVEFLQNTFQGLIDMEQSKVIKVFTVITICFAPPTIIAGIFGMNFENMPGLDYEYGFTLSIVLMLISIGGTLSYLKYKKWL